MLVFASLLAVTYIAEEPLSEADRAKVAQVLAREAPLIRSTFGTFGVSQVVTQAVRLDDGDIVVAAHARTDPEILLFRMDREGRTVWGPDVASIRSDARKNALKLVAGPEGDCFVAWLESGFETDGLVVRRVSKEGRAEWTSRVTGAWPLLNYDLASTPKGLLAVWVGRETVHCILIGMDGRLAWRRKWPTLSTDRSHPHNPVSCITVNGGRDVIVVWYRFTPRGNSFLAQRVGLRDGEPVWDGPVRLGEAPIIGLPGPEKVRLEQTADGAIKAFLSRGQRDDVGGEVFRYTVVVNPDGKVVRGDEAGR